MPNAATLLLTGSIAGLSIAMPVGPFSLLCVQRSLRGGFLPGFSTGLGGATVHAIAATALMFGFQHLLPALPGGGRALSALGGLLLLLSAARVLEARPACQRPAGADGRMGCTTAYLSAVAFNASNPLALALLFAVLSPSLSAGVPPPSHAAMLVAGLLLAASAWYGGLSLVTSLLRAQLGPAFQKLANSLAGLVLIVYAAVALAGACDF